MDNPDIFIVVNKGEIPTDGDDFDSGSNFDYMVERAKERVGPHTPQTIYKLIPVMEVSLEVTTKIITKDLSQP